MVSGRTKVYELAKDVGLESQQLVDVVRRLGIDVKSHMSILGSEEVRIVREHLSKARQAPPSGSAPPPKTNGSGSVVEKRVGSRIIRRRRVATPAKPAAPVETTPEVAAPEPTAPKADLEKSQTPVQTTESEVEVEAKAPPASEPIAEEVQPPSSEEATPASAAEAEKPKRRRFEPLIKRVSTEDHLSKQVGPKPIETPAKKKKPSTDKASTTGESTTTGPRRYKEVDMSATAPAEPAKPNKRRILQRQSSVFRKADFTKRELTHATRKRKATFSRPAMKTKITTPAAHKRVVEMAETISVSDLAREMGMKAGKVIEKLMGMGEEATINQSVDFDTASLIAGEFGFEINQKVFRETDFIEDLQEDPDKLQSRSPVVTVMGHVDHGKTSLLDTIRKSRVAAGESGGITQHIGAYQVKHKKGKVTFIDTPGHEAFTEMRARGAKVTDLVILVVSATDGVMPQTVESVNHAKAANVPMVVAVNKMDLPEANPDKVKQALAGYEVTSEDWGGDTIFVPVSAKTGDGIDALLEAVLLQAEMLELKANAECKARGIIVESKLDKNRGPMATVLVRAGRLRVGEIVVCGTVTGKIKALTDDTGKRAKEAGPSEPVEILGLNDVPRAGDELFVVGDEKGARQLVENRSLQAKQKEQASKKKMTLEELLAEPANVKELRVVLKADVQGSLEAIRQALSKFPTDKAIVKVLHSATGGITESDIMLAAASEGVVFGFNIRPDTKAQKVAEKQNVKIRCFRVIYELLDEVKMNLEGLLDAVVSEKVIGRCEVRDTFSVPKVGMVAGTAVIDGKVTRGCFLRVLRDSRVVYEGKLSSLRRFKDDVKEVQQGYECGISLENFNDIKTGDELEAYIQEESRESL